MMMNRRVERRREYVQCTQEMIVGAARDDDGSEKGT